MATSGIIRKKATIISYFSRSSAENVENDKENHLEEPVEEEVPIAEENAAEEDHAADADEENVAEEELQNQISENLRKRKRIVQPEFDGGAIQLKRTTRVNNLVLTSVEDTELPVVSSRSRDRQLPILKTTGPDRPTNADSRLEIAIRFRDNKDETLITKMVDGKVALWCTICNRTVNSNKVNMHR